MKLPKYNLCYNTRDLIKSLAENANDRNDVSFNQTRKILKHGVITSLKRIRTIEQLRFTQTCIQQRLTTNRISSSTEHLELKDRQRSKLESIIIKNVRNNLYKELNQREIEKKLAIQQAHRLLNKREINEYENAVSKEKSFALHRTRLHFRERLNKLKRVRDKNKRQTETKLMK